MTETTLASLDGFLVEDVILTLANLRGALGWLGQAGDNSRAGLGRFDRQLELLEDRARHVREALRGVDAAQSGRLVFRSRRA